MTQQIKLTPAMFPSGSLVTSIDETGLTHHLYKTSDESPIFHLLTVHFQQRVRHLTLKTLDNGALTALIGSTATVEALCNPQALAIFDGVLGFKLEQSGFEIPESPTGIPTRVLIHSDFKVQPLPMGVVVDAIECMIGKIFYCAFGLLHPTQAGHLRRAITITQEGEHKLSFENACKIVSSQFIQHHPFAKNILDSTLHAALRIRTEFSKDIVIGGNDGVYDLCLKETEQIGKDMIDKAHEIHKTVMGRVPNVLIKEIAMRCAKRDIQETASNLLQLRESIINNTVGIAA